MSPTQINKAWERNKKLAKWHEENQPKPPEFYKDENGIDRLKTEDNIDRTSFRKHETHEYDDINGTEDEKNSWCTAEQELNNPRPEWTIEQKKELAREIMKTFTVRKRRRPFDLAIISGNSGVFEDFNQCCNSVGAFLENRGYEYVEIEHVRLKEGTFKSSLFDIREVFLDNCFWVIDRKEITTLREDCFRLAYNWRTDFIFKSEFETSALGIRGYNTQDPSSQVYLTEVMVDYDMFSQSSFIIFHKDHEMHYGRHQMDIEDIKRELPI
jgi:hypothetical protein